jgi:hypothetical protein
MFEPDDAREFTEHPTTQEPGDDVVRNDGDEEAGVGGVKSPAGRLVLQSSPKVDRLRSESGKIVLEGEEDVLRRLRDVSERCREPERYYLSVLAAGYGRRIGCDAWCPAWIDTAAIAETTSR